MGVERSDTEWLAAVGDADRQALRVLWSGIPGGRWCDSHAVWDPDVVNEAVPDRFAAAFLIEASCRQVSGRTIHSLRPAHQCTTPNASAEA